MSRSNDKKRKGKRKMAVLTANCGRALAIPFSSLLFNNRILTSSAALQRMAFLLAII